MEVDRLKIKKNTVKSDFKKKLNQSTKKNQMKNREIP